MLYAIAILIIVLDQFIKWIVSTHMAVNQAIAIWPGVLDILYVQNRGAAFSILIDQRVLLIVVSLMVMLGVIYVNRRYAKGQIGFQIALGMLFGGAAGNLIDRVRLGYVVDYVYLQIIHFPVFNLADSAIDLSILYLILRFFRKIDVHENKNERRNS